MPDGTSWNVQSGNVTRPFIPPGGTDWDIMKTPLAGWLQDFEKWYGQLTPRRPRSQKSWGRPKEAEEKTELSINEEPWVLAGLTKEQWQKQKPWRQYGVTEKEYADYLVQTVASKWKGMQTAINPPAEKADWAKVFELSGLGTLQGTENMNPTTAALMPLILPLLMQQKREQERDAAMVERQRQELIATENMKQIQGKYQAENTQRVFDWSKQYHPPGEPSGSPEMDITGWGGEPTSPLVRPAAYQGGSGIKGSYAMSPEAIAEAKAGMKADWGAYLVPYLQAGQRWVEDYGQARQAQLAQDVMNWGRGITGQPTINQNIQLPKQQGTMAGQMDTRGEEMQAISLASQQFENVRRQILSTTSPRDWFIREKARIAPNPYAQNRIYPEEPGKIETPTEVKPFLKGNKEFGAGVTTPSMQQWTAATPTVQQQLFGYLEGMGQNPEDMLTTMKKSLPENPTRGNVWKPRLQYA